MRTLLNHLISGNYRFVDFAHGERGEAVPAIGDYVHDDALEPYRESAVAVSTVWREPGVLERTVHLPIGDVPGVVALGIHTVETIVHGWDLAQATGQPTELDPELYAVAWEHTKDIDDSLRGPGRPFGPAVAAPRRNVGHRPVDGLARPPTLTDSAQGEVEDAVEQVVGERQVVERVVPEERG